MKNELHLSSSCKKSLHHPTIPIPGESSGNIWLVVLRLKRMDRLALYNVKPNYSGKAQVAKGALLIASSSRCITSLQPTSIERYTLTGSFATEFTRIYVEEHELARRFEQQAQRLLSF